MSNKEKFEAAKKYIDKQLETMKQHGCEPKTLSSSQYKEMVKEAAKAIPG